MTTILECNCEICEYNANFLGKSFPLRMEYTANPAHEGRLNLKSKKLIHGFMHMAHHPVPALREGARKAGFVAV